MISDSAFRPARNRDEREKPQSVALLISTRILAPQLHLVKSASGNGTMMSGILVGCELGATLPPCIQWTNHTFLEMACFLIIASGLCVIAHIWLLIRQLVHDHVLPASNHLVAD